MDNGQVSRPGSLAGRAPALAALGAAQDAAMAGHGSLVLITGDPGIGKTALVAHFAGQVAASGVAVAWGRCAEAEGTPAFWPWTQVLRATGGLADGEDHIGPRPGRPAAGPKDGSWSSTGSRAICARPPPTMACWWSWTTCTGPTRTR